MDAKTSSKLGLKERYTYMTRGLAWDTVILPFSGSSKSRRLSELN